MQSLFARKLLLFDLDGTLVDSASDMCLAMNMALQQLNYSEVSELHIRQWVGKGANHLCQSVLKHVCPMHTSQQHQDLLAAFMLAYAANVCVHSALYQGVLDCLNACQAQGINMACITNKPQHMAEALLNALQLAHYFDLVLGGDALPQRKPDPLPLLYAIQYFGVTPAQTLMIGDSQNDVEAARRAGMDCIVVSYGYNHGEDIRQCAPQRVVDSLAELLI